MPSLRYVVGLSAPGLDIIGAGEPALPGIAIGHNDDIAFGITIFAIDQEDLYVYELKSDDPGSYRYGSGWEQMKMVRETIEVKGGAARDVVLQFTRHGPVLAADPVSHRAFAMRTAWNEPGVAGYFGSSRLLEAKNWNDFKTASNAWGAPPLNLVYADTRGNIGWAAQAARLCARIGTVSCPCPAMAATNGPAFTAMTCCRPASILHKDSLPPPMR